MDFEFPFYSPPSPPPPPPPPPSPQSPLLTSSHFLIVALLCISFIAVAIIYMLLRYFLARRSTTYSNTAVFSQICACFCYFRRSSTAPIHPITTTTNISTSIRITPHGALLDALPRFSYGVLTQRGGSLLEHDCAICLTRFEATDQLRLLPVCCHAFHDGCIGQWLATSESCPICRSPVRIDDEYLSTMFASSSSRSFRVEVGSVSISGRRTNPSESGRRTYSIGSGSIEFHAGEEALVEVEYDEAWEGMMRWLRN